MKFDLMNQIDLSVHQRITLLAKAQSQNDKFEQDILHYIETEKYDAVAGSKLLKALKENRQARRKVKDEMAQLQAMVFELNRLQQRSETSPQNQKARKGRKTVLSYLASH